MKIVALLVSLILFSGSCFADEILSKQATAFYSDNNYNKTIDLILQIDEKERCAQDWLLLGNLFDEKGEKENAIFMYQKAIGKDNKYYKAYYNLANIYLEQNKYNLAIDYYKSAIHLSRENAYLYYNLGCAYLKTGDAKKAKTAFINALTYKKDVPEFHYNLAYTYKLLKKDKLAQSYLDNYNKMTGGQG